MMRAPTTAKHSPQSGKEEGELSGSEGDGQPVCSIAMQTSTSAPLTGNVSVPLAKRQFLGCRTGNAGAILTSAYATPLLLKQHGSQKVEKKQATCKSSTHGKSMPARDNKNLVISFSDDDSGSESDTKERGRTSKIQPKVVSMRGNGNRPIPSLAKLKGPCQIDKSISNTSTQNVSSSRTFIRSVNSKVSNPSIAKPLESRKPVSTSGRKLSGKENHSDQGVGLNSYKLQDLRQKIARRESELKLKAAKSNKDDSNEYIDSARRSTMVSADVKQLEPKEPAKKRLKVTVTDSTPLVLDDRVPVSASIPSAEPCVKNSQLPGSDANVSYKRISGNCEWIDPHAISQCIVEGNTSSNTLHKSTKEANYSGVKFGQPNFPVHTTSRQQDTTMKIDGTVSSDHLIKTSSEKYQPCLDSSGPWITVGNTSVSGRSQLDILALTNMEESLDRELEETQEYRRMCEIEERNALKAYRKAQRSLIEANARCAELYRKREMCSALFGSLVVHDPNLSWPSRCENTETMFGLLNKSTENHDMGTTSDHCQHIQPECSQDINNVNGGQGVPTSHSGQNLGSEPCSDPDASTSDRLPYSHKQTVSRLCSPFTDANVSPDDDGSFPVDLESSQQNLEGQQQEIHEETRCNQNPLLLEASLRAKLFERLGIRAESKIGEACPKGETLKDRGTESDVTSEKADAPVLFPEKYWQGDFGGTDRVEGNSCNTPVEKPSVKKNSLIFQSTADLKSDRLSPGVELSSMSVALPGPFFLSTFNHLKVTGCSLGLLESEHTFQNKSYSLYTSEMQGNNLVEALLCERKIGFYTSDVKVDPSWPLCMYELRGRCNNDECSWQHFKDFSQDSMHQNQPNNPGLADFQHGSTFHHKKHNSVGVSQIADMMLSPTYFVCLDTMKVDAHSYKSVITQRHGQSWWKCFSICLASSDSLRKGIPDENEGRVEVLGNLRMQSSYFGSKHSLMSQLKQGSNAAVEPLEMALTVCQETDEHDGLILALSLLSRSLEADPTSELLWIVYLLIYHSCERSEGKDDMLSCAVKHNRRSYALWLMYINSRRQLKDELIAYDDALSALCHHASASDIDRKYASACILDIFLQMINVLCISGNVTEAIQRICRLLNPAAVSDHPHFLMLSDILTWLTLSDKCVFWVCCVYLVVYRKLPDSIVQGLEMEKELLSIEWPSVDLEGDQKLMALRFFERGVQSVKLCSGSGSFENGGERSAHLFALSHSLFMIAIHELEKCRDLLKRYTELYPASLELKLLVARMQPSKSEDMYLAGFKELLKNQPEEGFGTQCIWNQYAEYALRGGKCEFAREVMACWHASVWEVSSRNTQTVAVQDVGPHGLLNSALSDTSAAAERVDMMFGYCNLSLHNLLQNNHAEACLAIDEALKATTPEHFMHCLREHAAFQLIKEFRATGVFPMSLQLRLLKRYMDWANSFPVKEPLSWKFVSSADKPRVRKLVAKLLTPVSSELVVVNAVLEAWYGPSLLPQKLSKHKDLVDFVEAILELVPWNYPLALSVCKLLRNEWSGSHISSAGIQYWAGSNLVTTISGAVPIPPEYIWVEAGDILSSIISFKTRTENFLNKALSVYPFSVDLWRCYRRLSKSIGNTEAVEEKAREKGIKLD